MPAALSSRGFLLLLALLPLGAAAQQPAPAAPVTAAAPAPTAKPDVIVRTNGEEIPARVLLVAPDKLRYFSLADPSRPGTDTLSVARQDVFMVRYANGTKDVLPADAPTSTPEPVSLAGLTNQQRYELGTTDARQSYQPSKGVFWGTFGATFVGGVLGGVGTGVAIGTTPPRRANLLAQARQPALLNDASYYRGYSKQAQSQKLGKAAAGFGVGVGAQVAIAALIIGAMFSRY